MFNDHEGFPFQSNLGLFSRGEDDTVPADHFVEATNIEFKHKTWNTRHGFIPYLGLNSNGFPILRVHLYQRVGESPRYLFLNSNGDLMDSFSMPTVLINIPGAIDFSCISLFNRSYVTFHDRITGKNGGILYVYDGTTFRQAAGLAPVAPTFGITNGNTTTPRVSKGIHLFSVSYETASGFITKPGPVVVYKAPGTRKVNVNNIPIGPVGTVARHILVTKVIKTYDGNPSNYELFFWIKISDNVTTALANVGFLDSSLVNSADYLLDLFESIPAFVALAEYQGSLVGVGEFGKESVYRVSLAGNAESFSTVDGFGICYPGDGGGIRNVKEYRGNLYLFKENRTFSTRANGQAPSTWTPILIDAAIGTGCFGLSQILDSSGDSRDNMLIASTAGLMQFYGRYTDKPLSWKIESTWLNLIDIEQAQICIDPGLKRVYIINSDDSFMLMGDMSNGLSPDDIRWSVWRFNKSLVDPDLYYILKDIIFAVDGFVMLTDAATPNLVRLDGASTADQVEQLRPIQTTVQYPYVANPESAVANHNAFRAQIRGLGILESSIIGTDGVIDLPNVNLTLVSAPGQDYTRKFNVNSERASFRMHQFSASFGYIASCSEAYHFAIAENMERPA